MAKKQKKERKRISDELSSEVLFDHEKTCCVCNTRGKPVQIHHIDEDPSNNSKSNLAVLCLFCHDDTMVSGGFGRKLNAPLVLKFRNDWVNRVISRRNEADRIAVDSLKLAGANQIKKGGQKIEFGEMPIRSAEFIERLPKAYSGAKELVAHGFSGSTQEMVGSAYELVDVLSNLWGKLIGFSLMADFNGQAPDEFLTDYISNRYVWYRTLAEPLGAGTGGSIVSPITVSGVISDLEASISQTVRAIAFSGENHEAFDVWEKQWIQATNYHPD